MRKGTDQTAGWDERAARLVTDRRIARPVSCWTLMGRLLSRRPAGCDEMSDARPNCDRKWQQSQVGKVLRPVLPLCYLPRLQGYCSGEKRNNAASVQLRDSSNDHRGL